MPQFFLPPAACRDKTFRLEGPEAYHISKVLRHREGDVLEFFDGRGGRYRGVLASILPDGSVSGKLSEVLEPPRRGPRVALRLCQGLLKASRWEWVLEKGTEIGVSAFLPLVTQRTVVLLRDAEQVRSKEERWRKILLSAAKQCGRADLPRLDSPVPLREALRQAAREGLVLFGWEGMAGSPASATLRDAIHSLSGGPGGDSGVKKIELFIGPEGGFTEEEVELAGSLGAHFFGLGPSTLRGETAAIAACSLALYELGVL